MFETDWPVLVQMNISMNVLQIGNVREHVPTVTTFIHAIRRARRDVRVLMDMSETMLMYVSLNQLVEMEHAFKQ